MAKHLASLEHKRINLQKFLAYFHLAFELNELIIIFYGLLEQLQVKVLFNNGKLCTVGILDYFL